MNTRNREICTDQRWEMYDLPSGSAAGIGIRNAATGRKVAHVSPGPHDLDNARMIELAPRMLAAIETVIFALGRKGANVLNGPNRAEWELLQSLANQARGGN